MTKKIVVVNHEDVLGLYNSEAEAEWAVIQKIVYWLTFPNSMSSKRFMSDVVDDEEFVNEILLMVIHEEFTDVYNSWNDYVEAKKFHNLEFQMFEGEDGEVPIVSTIVSDAKRLYSHLNAVSEASIPKKG